MTISNENSSFTLNGNDATTSFPFTLKCFDEADITLTLIDTLGNDTALALDTHYSVTLNADQDTTPGGTITYPISGTPLATGASILGEYDLEYTQSTSISNTGFYPADVEQMDDRVTILLKQLKRLVDRCIKIPSSMLATTTTTSAKTDDITGKTFVGQADGTFLLSALGSVSLAVPADGSVTSDKLASNAVITAKVADDAITYAKMQNVSATDKVLGRSTAGAGDVEEIACTASGRAMIAAASAAAQFTLLDNAKTRVIASSVSNQNIATATVTKILWPTEALDTLAEYNDTNSTFTPTYSGMYSVHCRIEFDSATWAASAYARIDLYKDGSQSLAGDNKYAGNAGSASTMTVTETFTQYLVAGAVYDLRVYHTQGSTRAIQGGSSTGCRVTVARL